MRILLQTRPSAKTKIKLINSIRIASILEMSGTEFVKLIQEVESDPVFLKLLSVPDKNCRVLKRLRFPNSGFGLNLCELKEELANDEFCPGLAGLISTHKEAVDLVCRIGRHKFEKYFLYNEDFSPAAEILEHCRINEKEAGLINVLVDQLSILGEFSSFQQEHSKEVINYSRIAAIEKDDAGALVINFLSPKIVSGRYSVDLSNLHALKKAGFFTKDEARSLKGILEKIEMINSRKSILYAILQKILERQAAFFEKCDEGELNAFTQVELANETSLDSSVVSRAVFGRSIITPDSVERPLKYFLPSKKKVRARLIDEILAKTKAQLTDTQLKSILEKEYGIDMARRTINASRHTRRYCAV
jgi:hypothetical protein